MPGLEVPHDGWCPSFAVEESPPGTCLKNDRNTMLSSNSTDKDLFILIERMLLFFFTKEPRKLIFGRMTGKCVCAGKVVCSYGLGTKT